MNGRRGVTLEEDMGDIAQREKNGGCKSNGTATDYGDRKCLRAGHSLELRKESGIGEERTEEGVILDGIRTLTKVSGK